MAKTYAEKLRSPKWQKKRLEVMQMVHAPEVVASVIKWLLTDRDFMILAKDSFFEYLHEKSKRNG